MDDEHVTKCCFDVTAHFTVSNRGAFLIGNVVEGKVKLGMYVRTMLEPPILKINAVEIVCGKSGGHWWHSIGLGFTEGPTLEFIKRAFPVGSLIEVHTQDEPVQ